MTVQVAYIVTELLSQEVARAAADASVALAVCIPVEMDARLRAAVSSWLMYSMISAQRLENLMVPTFFWFDRALAVSLFFFGVHQSPAPSGSASRDLRP
jgi:hypothetical protein